VGLIGGALVVWRPEVGVYAMFVMLLFKPEAIQGLGLLGPNALISLVLASLLFVNVLAGGTTDFLRSNQIRCYALLGVLFAVNWVLVGRVQAPGDLAELDHTARSLYRYVVHLSLLVFIIAFVRTKRQLLVLTGLFIAAILVTIPGALSVSSEIESKMTALRAAAVGAVRSAENANRLAFMCLMGISVVWFAIQYYRSRLLRAGGALLILFLVLTVFRSGSRSGCRRPCSPGPRSRYEKCSVWCCRPVLEAWRSTSFGALASSPHATGRVCRSRVLSVEIWTTAESSSASV